MNLANKILIFFVLLFVAPLLVFSLWTLGQARSGVLLLSSQKITSLAELYEEIVVLTAQKNIDTLHGITSRTQLRRSLDSYIQGGDASDIELIRTILRDAKAGVPAINTISIIGSDGTVIASTEAAYEGIEHASGELAKRALFELSARFAVQPQEAGPARLVLGEPLVFEGKRLGAAVIDVFDSELAGLTQERSGLGENGELLLAVRGDGGEARFLTPRRFEDDPDALLTVPPFRDDIPITHALRGEAETFELLTDYRGEPVMAATRLTPTLEIGIVVKQDISEILDPFLDLRNTFIAVMLLVVIAGFLISVLLSRYISEPIARLARISDEFSHGDFSSKDSIAVNGRRDELGRLSCAFVAMANQIESSYDEMQRRVRKATADIRDQARRAKEQKKLADDTKLAVMNVLEDLEEENRRNAKIARDLEKFRLGVENLEEHFIITDPDAVVLYANPAVTRITGYSQEEVIGQKPSLWGAQMPREFYDELWHTISEEKKPFSGEIKNKRKNGEIYDAEISIAPLLDENGEVEFYVGVERDITERKRLDQSKSEFISIASHQLRTPLSAVRWYAEMLSDNDVGELNPKQREYADLVYENVERLAKLINELLNISRIEGGKLSVEPSKVNVAVLVRDVVKNLSPIAEAKNCEIKVKAPKSALSVISDEDLLRQVITNLVSNAIKYSRKVCKVGIQISSRGEGVEVSVKDRGMGIGKEEQQRIFEKFFRAEEAVVTETEGSGLGLYISKKILETLRGRIWFESKKGKGSTFYFWIPKDADLEAQKGKKLSEKGM